MGEKTEQLTNLENDTVLHENNKSESVIIETSDSSADSTASDIEGKDSCEDFVGAKDYEEIMRKDMQELLSLFPHLSGKTSIRELDNPLRYAALRDLGLSPKEAYLACSDIGMVYDNRSHITASAPRGASSSQDVLSSSDLEAARMIFSDLSDRDIQKLYKKVTK